MRRRKKKAPTVSGHRKMLADCAKQNKGTFTRTPGVAGLFDGPVSPGTSTLLRAILFFCKKKNTPNRRHNTLVAPPRTSKKVKGEWFLRTLKQTCSQDYPRAPLAFKNSMIHMFCNSHYVSHFAAFFIDVGAKISSVTSFILGFLFGAPGKRSACCCWLFFV